MATKIISTAATASGDTTKTLIGILDVPADAVRIVGVLATNRGAATITTGEAITGLIELESNDFDVVCQIPFDDGTGLTGSGLGPVSRAPVAVDIPCPGRGKVKCYVTMDMAQTGALTSRIALIFEN